MNVSKLTPDASIFPAYSLYCDRGEYINQNTIVEIDWILDISNISYFQSKEWLDSNNQGFEIIEGSNQTYENDYNSTLNDTNTNTTDD